MKTRIFLTAVAAGLACAQALAPRTRGECRTLGEGAGAADGLLFEPGQYWDQNNAAIDAVQENPLRAAGRRTPHVEQASNQA